MFALPLQDRSEHESSMRKQTSGAFASLSRLFRALHIVAVLLQSTHQQPKFAA